LQYKAKQLIGEIVVLLQNVNRVHSIKQVHKS